MPQHRLARQRHRGHIARARTVRIRADTEHDRFSSSSLERRVNAFVGAQRLAIDGQQVLACVDIHAGLGQRRAKVRIPVLAGVNFGEAPAPIVDRVVSAEQAVRRSPVGVVLRSRTGSRCLPRSAGDL